MPHTSVMRLFGSITGSGIYRFLDYQFNDGSLIIF